LGKVAPSAAHPFGTDQFSRDVLSRTLYGGRLSLSIALLAVALSATIGTAYGAIAGLYGGLIDMVMMRALDALLAIPRLVLLLVCAALWRPGLATVLVVLVATGWMGVARMVRAEVLGVRALPYVDAAFALGAAPWRVLWRHALPNAVGPAIVATTLGVGNAILLESGLSFLGLGIQPPQASWGNMIAGGRELIVTAPWVAIAPGLALIITVLACTLLGDALRDRLAGETAAAARAASERCIRPSTAPGPTRAISFPPFHWLSFPTSSDVRLSILRRARSPARSSSIPTTNISTTSTARTARRATALASAAKASAETQPS
jgi:peptide/nickel transport system permease protein